MKTGLLIGKFMPVHQGHRRLIQYACRRCERLLLVLCVADSEPIPGPLRYEWLSVIASENPRIDLRVLNYDEKIYSNTSESSREVARQWATLLKHEYPEVNIIFSSEPYGNYLGEFMEIESDIFDVERRKCPVAGSSIRENPEEYWFRAIPFTRPFLIDSFCIIGTESTGKSTLTRKLAEHFGAKCVSEAGRDLAPQTEECRFETLQAIATTHAEWILESLETYQKTLFVDTDLVTTQSYSKFLFGKELPVLPWVTAVNRFKYYLYLENDAPYIQDGTRLSKEKRDELDAFHRAEYASQGIKPIFISGRSWEEREAAAFRYAEKIIMNQRH